MGSSKDASVQRPTNMAVYADVDLFSGEGVDPTALIMTIINA
jgi:hypothetical protein